jgi:hypothetical protein
MVLGRARISIWRRGGIWLVLPSGSLCRGLKKRRQSWRRIRVARDSSGAYRRCLGRGYWHFDRGYGRLSFDYALIQLDRYGSYDRLLADSYHFFMALQRIIK